MGLLPRAAANRELLERNERRHSWGPKVFSLLTLGLRAR